MKKIFQGVAGNNPRLNRFDLSYTNTTTMNFGYLYPVQCDEVYPGDVFKMSAFVHSEIMPLVAPLMSDIQMFVHVFFTPHRISYGVDTTDGKSVWEKFITGGEDGDYSVPLPSWSPDWSKVGFSSLKIWDYIGNPVSHDSLTGTWTPVVPYGLDVSIAPKYAYNLIYNSFYRDENLIDEVDLDNEDLLKVSFKKDYFTSALESQQRGTAPALPVDVNVTWPTLTGSVGLDGSITGAFSGLESLIQYKNATGKTSIANSLGVLGSNVDNYAASSSGSTPAQAYAFGGNNSSYKPFYTIPNGNVSITNGLSVDNTLGLSSGSATATTFTVSDLRLAFAIQRLLELSMRSGGQRYTEFLGAHFGVNPTDARLDRPEYIGGAVMNVSISPLVQTSESATTPQGTKSGIGHIDSIQKLGNYRVLEHGVIMTLVSIRPKPIYHQGVNRQWLRQTRFDYYFPEFAYLSEQGIFNAELYVDGNGDAERKDNDIFGYQAHWNEMRCKNNLVSGAVRDQFKQYALARTFDNRPALNQDFIEIDEADFEHVFAVQNEDPFVVSYSALIDAYRPIPALGVPGLIDHVYGGR